MTYPLNGGPPRRLTNPGNDATDTSPLLSPDGRYLAFLRNRAWHAGSYGAASDGEILVLPVSAGMVSAGQPVRVSGESCCISDLAWTGDGEIPYVVWRTALKW